VPIDFSGIAATIIDAAEKGVRDAADVVLQEAIERAPQETGELRNSGAVDSEGLEATVYFDTPYAVRQHEELGYHHEVGEAKYLENAVIASREKVGAVISEAVRRVL
jgi:hypothetical protein